MAKKPSASGAWTAKRRSAASERMKKHNAKTVEARAQMYAARREFPDFAARALYIRPKSGPVQPLVLNDVQELLHRMAERQRAKTGRVRMLVLKARQPGGGQFPASAHEQALDRIVMLLQQMDEEVARALKIPTSDVVGTYVETSSAAMRAQKVVCYDEDGNLTESTLTIEEIEAGTTDAAASAENAAESAEDAALSSDAAAASALAADQSADAAALSETNAQSYASQAASTLASAMWRDIVHLTATNSPYTIASADNGKLLVCDSSAGEISIQLGTIASLGEPFNISVKWESGANPVTVNRAGTDTIDGATSYILTSINSAVMLVADMDTAPDQWEKVEINAPIEVTFDTLPARMKTAVRLSLFNFAR
jgi:hypothetical protein